MQTLNNLPEEMQMVIARNLGYDGKKEGFPAYLMSNRRVADKYTALENAFKGQQEFRQQALAQKMAEGGLMKPFEQNQQQPMVGGYVPPPKQSFATGGQVAGITTTMPTAPTINAPDKQQYDFGIPEADLKPTLPDLGGGGYEMPIYGGPAPIPDIGTPLPDPTPTPPASTVNVETTPTVAPPSQNFTGTTRPVIDTNEFLEDGTTPNPNYNKPVVDTNEFLDDGVTPNPNYNQPLTEEVGPTIGDVSSQMLTTPGLPAGSEIQTVATTATPDQLVGDGVGQLTGDVALGTAQASTTTINQQDATSANTITADTVAKDVNKAVENLQGATTVLDLQSQVSAAQQETSAVSGLEAAQGVATTMENPVQREIQDGELISGAANAEKAAKYTEQIQAATALPSEKATVQGQLAGLTANFDSNNPPPWAAGTLRAISAKMAARGMGASSMAGQAMLQGALESALPIAQADAATTASFEAQNLSNRQARAMLAAEQRATFLGQEFDQDFKARVQNSARIGDIADKNFTAEQSIALENSRAAQTMNLENLKNNQALVIAEAAALADLDMANLDNRQKAAVQNANAFLQKDMAELSNQQQADMFSAQQQVQALFTDQAATNAAKQFNATSENQVDQFFASLNQVANQFNASQKNAQEQFNAGQTNTIERFNAEINNQRDQFNAQNQTVIAQSNANWRRQIATEGTAATNRANELNAQNILGISQTAYNNLWQHYGDTMEWAWTSTENERSRVVELAMAQLQADSSTNIQKMKDDTASSTAFGQLVGKFITGGIFGGGGFF